jgi:hypothetical protein
MPRTPHVGAPWTPLPRCRTPRPTRPSGATRRSAPSWSPVITASRVAADVIATKRTVQPWGGPSARPPHGPRHGAGRARPPLASRSWCWLRPPLSAHRGEGRPGAALPRGVHARAPSPSLHAGLDTHSRPLRAPGVAAAPHGPLRPRDALGVGPRSLRGCRRAGGSQLGPLPRVYSRTGTATKIRGRGTDAPPRPSSGRTTRAGPWSRGCKTASRGWGSVMTSIAPPGRP